MQRKQNGGLGLGRGRLVMAVGVAGVALAAALHGVAAPVVTTAVYGPGDFDPDFGNGGAFYVDYIPGETSNGGAVAEQPDGRILVGGGTASGENNWTYRWAWALSRYLSDGTPDSTFGNGGTITAWSRTQAMQRIMDIAVQPDGKIVAIGDVGSNNGDVGIARWNSNGSVDTSFGSRGSGRVSTDIGKKTTDTARGLAIQSDGKLVVCGTSNDKLAIVRYTATGSLDNTFDGDGKLMATPGGAQWPTAVKVQPDGKIVVSGANYGQVIVRYHSNGSLDGSFGSGGVATLPDLHFPHDFQFLPDGKIVVAGAVDWYYAFFARLNSDGSLDSTFGTGGVVHPPMESIQRGEMIVESDGKVVFAGQLALCRIHSSGALDSTFGSGGVLSRSDFYNVAHNHSLISSISGDIIWGVHHTFGSSRVARVLPDDPALLIAPNPIPSSGNVALAVGETHGLNGAIQGVDFWVDVDGDAALDDAIDQFLAAGTYNGTFDIWESNGPNPAPVGMATFFAVTHYAGGDTVVAEQAEVVP